MPEAQVIHWIVFHVLVVVLLTTEAILLRRKVRFAPYIATAIWILSAVGFGVWLFGALHPRLGQEFLAGYALEESLSIDNLFVFLLLFKSFKIEDSKQRRVLFWGILGAVVMRAAFIVAGVELLNKFEWITYVFAVLLLVAAVRLVIPSGHDEAHTPGWMKWLQKRQPISLSQDGFFVVENGKKIPTVLLMALGGIAVTDFIFALDSIPAVLSITRHTFIAYSSNILAVMGLRSLFFVLADALKKLEYLHFGLAAVLAFAAIKMLVAPWFEVTAVQSLAVIAGLLAVTIVVSLILQKRNAQSGDSASSTPDAT